MSNRKALIKEILQRLVLSNIYIFNERRALTPLTEGEPRYNVEVELPWVLEHETGQGL